MRIRTRDFVNARTSDGRPFAAGAGTERHVDDGDRDMLALMRQLASKGQVEILAEESKLAVVAPDDPKATGVTDPDAAAAADPIPADPAPAPTGPPAGPAAPTPPAEAPEPPADPAPPRPPRPARQRSARPTGGAAR